ncbi:MAG: YggS family pyridoxal phosphate-dependent enzyme [Oscillospiraceae bacterium]
MNPPEFKYILENYQEICYNVENAKAKYRSSNEKIDIMAVTKTVAPEKINFAISQGITLLGENRVQEYLSKKDVYDKSAQVHMIGHLQTNKVKYIINDVSMIQSVDSIKLAKEIDRLALKNGISMDILVEVNIGDEISKSGIGQNDLLSLIEEISQLKNVSVKGLMAIPPIGSGEDIFDKMHSLFLDLKERAVPNVSMEILSMGMSGDYELAIKHGSNLVRIGTKLFGARKYLEV